MTTHRLTLTITGRLGPYRVLTEEAIRGLADRLEVGSVVAYARPNGQVGIGRLAAPASVDAIGASGQYAIHADVELDDTDDTPAAIAEAEAVSRSAEGL